MHFHCALETHYLQSVSSVLSSTYSNSLDGKLVDYDGTTLNNLFLQTMRQTHIKYKLEIRSLEHGICPIAEFTSPLLSCAAILAIRP